MNIFVINIILIVCEGLWLLSQVPTQRNKKKFCYIASIQWILISGLRHISVGADTEQYYNNFERIKTYTWDYVFDFTRTQLIMDSDAKAPGYTFLVKVFQLFSDDYQVFLVFIAVVFFACMGWSVYRNSKNPALSYILFSCLFYSFFAITGIRQTLATAIVLFVGIEFIKKRKLIPFVICILLMATVHLSVVCFLPFYWLSLIKINIRSIIVYWIAIITAFIFRNQLLLILQYLAGYEGYTQTEGASAGTFLYLLMLVAVITSVFNKQIISGQEEYIMEDNNNKGKYLPMLQLSMNAIFIACFFSPLLLINQNMMRVVQYYSLFLLFYLPEIPNMFSERRYVWIYNYALIITLVLMSLNRFYQYYFFWQNI